MSSLISAQEWQAALELFRKMPVVPDVRSYSAAMSASALGACWQMALAFFADLRGSKLRADVPRWVCWRGNLTR